MIRKINNRKNEMLDLHKRLKDPSITMEGLDKIEAEIMMQYIKMPAQKSVGARIREYCEPDSTNRLERIESMKVAVGEPLKEIFYLSRETRDEIWEFARECNTHRIDFLCDPSKKEQYERDENIRKLDRYVNEDIEDTDTQVHKAQKAVRKHGNKILEMIFKAESTYEKELKARKELDRKVKRIEEMYEPKGAARSTQLGMYINSYKPTESLTKKNDTLRRMVRLDLLSKMREMLVKRRKEVKAKMEREKKVGVSLDAGKKKRSARGRGDMREEKTEGTVKGENVDEERQQISRIIQKESRSSVLKNSSGEPLFITEKEMPSHILNNTSQADESSFVEEFISQSKPIENTISTLEPFSLAKHGKRGSSYMNSLQFKTDSQSNAHQDETKIGEEPGRDIILETTNPEESISTKNDHSGNKYYLPGVKKITRFDAKQHPQGSRRSSNSNRSLENRLNEKQHRSYVSRAMTSNNNSHEMSGSNRLDSLIHPSTATRINVIDQISFQAADMRRSKEKMVRNLNNASKDAYDAFTLITFDKSRDEQSLFANPTDYVSSESKKPKLKQFREYIRNRNEDNRIHNERMVHESAALKQNKREELKILRGKLFQKVIEIKKIGQNLGNMISTTSH